MTMKKTSVLLVDDSLTVRMDLTEALEAAHLRVVACTTVAEANAALEDGEFGLIILDVILPDGDGVDLLEHIRETPALNGVAVILLSDESAVRDRIRGLITGADEYIGKPYDARYVVACAQGLLRRGDGGAETQDTILVIDDSVTFCEEMREALEGASYKVLIANSGEEGLRTAANTRPAAIVLDRALPGIDGVAVLRAIRLDAALRHIPCILLTVSEEQSDEVAALDAGADAFVRKDEDMTIILARLGVVLRNAKDARAADRGKASLQGPIRILAVGRDEPFLRQVTGDLRAEGYEVVQARSGEEAFDLLSAQTVDCILLDLDMPDIASDEACRRIKTFSFSSNMPIIMTVAQDDREAIIRCLAAGADDYVSKTNDAAVLRSRVLAQIRRKQFEDENRHIREQRAIHQTEIAGSRAAREDSEMRSRVIDRCRAEIALHEFCLNLALESRWSAMTMIVNRLAQDIATSTARLAKCLDHAQRTVMQEGAPQSGHLTELLNEARNQMAQARATIEKYRKALAGHGPARVPQDLNELIREMMALGTAGGWSAEGGIKTALADDLPPVAINKAQLQQVLLAIVHNSLAALRKVNRPDITVTTASIDSGRVRVMVADNNATTAAENMFGARTDVASSDETLDREICRSIIEGHGGTIWSETTGTGSRVTIELPIAV